MLNPLHRAGPQRSLDLTATQPRLRSQQTHNPFQLENLALIKGGPARRAGPVGPVPSTKSQVLGSNASPRQDAVAASATASAAPPKPTGDAAVLQSLDDALGAAGISTQGLGLAVHQDVVNYPGGSYVNRYISVQTNGHEEGLMTDLVAINPNVAVLDIKHMLGRG